MKIQAVSANNRRRSFEVVTRQGALSFPYSLADPRPTPKDRITKVIVDPELGREAFTFVLSSGAEGSIHIDSVLDYHGDPTYRAELQLYNLTTEAKKQFERSGLSVRQLAERLGTSPPQVYRLLDPTNYSKSAIQLLRLIYLVGSDVDVSVRPRSGRATTRQRRRSDSAA